MQERATGVPVFELLPAAPSLGLQRLPTPDPGDLYLDFEGDPYVEPAGREYLAGVGNRAGGFEPFWAHSVDEEAQLTADLIDRLLLQLGAHPGMHVYHYAPYEKSALQRLTARHGVREAELDMLLRAEVLVDLYAVVRQGVRISKESYSIKKLEAFYWGHTRQRRRRRRRDVQRGRLRAVARRGRRFGPGADPGVQRRRREIDAGAA